MVRAANSSSKSKEARTLSASSRVCSNFVNKAALGMRARSENSLDLCLKSGSPPKPAIIHWRTLPHKCKIKFPALLLFSWALHHKSSSSSTSRHFRIFGRKSSIRRERASLRNGFLTSFADSITVFLPTVVDNKWDYRQRY